MLAYAIQGNDKKVKDSKSRLTNLISNSELKQSFDDYIFICDILLLNRDLNFNRGYIIDTPKNLKTVSIAENWE